MLNIVFLGSSDFAVESLKTLLNRHRVLAVVTQPDRPKGRHLITAQTPVKIAAQACGLPVLQPEKINSSEAISVLRSFKADLFVVVSFGQILRQEVLTIPGFFCLNVHGSILPRWRGAAPVNWSIIKGDKTSGVTIIKMNEFMDRGDILLSKETEISNSDTAVTLSSRLSKLGAEVLLEALNLLENNRAKFSVQDEKSAVLAPKLKKEDGLIDWQNNAQSIHDKVRGLLPWPCAYTYLDNKFLKLLKTKVVSRREKDVASPGSIIDIVKNEGILVAAGSDYLLISELQLEGKRAMKAYDFYIGHKLKIGQVFGPKKS